MEMTNNKKRRIFFRGVSKVKLYLKTDPLRVFMYLAEMDKYEEFSPERFVYKTDEVRVKVLTKLGLKKRAIFFAKKFSLEENTFSAHQLLIKTLIQFFEFKKASIQARLFTDRHISKKYKNLLAMVFHRDFNHEKNKSKIKRKLFVKSRLRTTYCWFMTTSTIIQLRMWADLHLREFKKKKNRWKHKFKKTVFFWRRFRKKEIHTDLSSMQ